MTLFNRLLEPGHFILNINLTPKTYNGEWAFVGESVQQPGQFALGEFRHLALKEHLPLLAEALRAAGMAWKKDPLPVTLLQKNLCQQPTTFGAVQTVPAQAARRKEAGRRRSPRSCHPPARRSESHA